MRNHILFYDWALLSTKPLDLFDVGALPKDEFLNEIITFGSLRKFLKIVTHVENSILVFR